ncbi:MAG: PorP/SprF family type IX secretion system membrane protein [Saprospirales bacterium]|nr:PorP/SprF family type IX secretion system membrane protein [Saprospirales bacterium]MBK6905073.1 PorP/SprF family type IX secretion system membrane protein [Saprospirales bacterium]MBK7335267.1 PorP/SprF family type IX secretion system membrane protein [Saprospirales bacterium]
MTRRILYLSLFMCMTSLGVKAQDPIFSQFYAAPAQLNPALAGTTYAPRIGFNYRNQWPGLNAYVTYAAAYEQFAPSINSGFGLMLLGDDQGEGLIKSTQVKGLYSYRLRVVDDLFVKIGVEAGFSQSRYDWDRFVFLDQLDKLTGPFDPSGSLNPSEEQRPENTSTSYFDIGAGMVAYTRHFYAGFSMRHLTQPEDGVLRINDQITDGLPLLYSLHVGTEITLREGNKRRAGSFISPNLLVIRQADFGQINVGAYGGLGAFFLGTWYRHAWSNPDALIFLAGARYGIFKIGYSYDLTLSELASAPSGGSHEISFILNFENSEAFKRHTKNTKYNDCFQIFR